jgi:hypothetical protein
MSALQKSFFNWVLYHSKLSQKQFVAVIKDGDDKVLAKYLKSLKEKDDKVEKEVN